LLSRRLQVFVQGKYSMATLEKYILRIINFIIVFCLASMMLMVFVNVVLRYGFNSGITFSEDVSRLFFVWL